MILFGSSAPLLVDINILLQYITLSLLIVGYIKRKPFKTHGQIMLLVLLITIGTTIFIMAPRLATSYSTHGSIILAHTSIGLLSMILGGVFAIRFIVAIRKNTPLQCGTKNWMRLALILWLIPILAGTGLYVTTYL
jgi:hypothetical protein